MWITRKHIDKTINNWVVFVLDLFYHIKSVITEQYGILSQKNKAIKAINNAIQPILCDILIVKNEIGLRDFLFNIKEKTIDEVVFEWFALEFKIAHKTTYQALNQVDADIDINPWDYFVEFHITSDQVKSSWTYEENIARMIELVKTENARTYNWKVKYLLWVSDLAKFMPRYWFEYATISEYAQSKTLLYNLKHWFFFKYSEIIWHAIDKALWKNNFTENPQLKISSKKRKDAKIGVCYLKLI